MSKLIKVIKYMIINFARSFAVPPQRAGIFLVKLK
jgi:hypothetical protein